MAQGASDDIRDVLGNVFRSSISFVIADARMPDCPIIYASPSFFQSTGYSPERVLGKNCRFLQGPQTSRRKVAEIRDALREDRSCSVCLLNYRHDGSTFWNQFYLAPVKDDQGRVSLYIGIQCDVTAAVKAACADADDPDTLLETYHNCNEPSSEALEAALRSCSLDKVLDEAQPCLHRAASSRSGGSGVSVDELPTSLLGPLLRIQSSFVLADPSQDDCPIVHVSDAFLHMTGYPRDEVLGRNCRFLQGEGTDPEEVAKVREALAAQPPHAVTATLVNYRSDGTPFVNGLHVAPIRDAHGKVRFFAGVQIDLGAPPDTALLELRARDKLKHKSCVAALRVAVRSLADDGLRRSLDCQRIPDGLGGE